MATEIKVKKIGMSIAPITLVEWKVKEGGEIKEGEVVLIVETEKIRHDIEAKGSGLLHIIVPEMGEALPGNVVGLIAETAEELSTLQQQKAPAGAAAPDETPAATPQVEDAVATAAPKRARRDRVLISPLARKLAEKHLVDISKLTSSGPDGRITREDVERYLETGGEAAPANDGRELASTVPLTGTRQAIAEHMHRSLSISAQLTAMGEIDMSEAVKVRESLIKQEATWGTRVTYTDLMLFLLARVLKEYPMVNTSIIDNEIKVWKNINIAVAVDVEAGLLVPVVKDADKKSLPEISREVKVLAGKARERTLTSDEVKGGTFTLSNLGALSGGWRFDTLIINQPQSAILGTGGISDRAVVREGQIVIRPIMTYSFTYDHRIIDGALAARFMNSLIELLEKPGAISDLMAK